MKTLGNTLNRREFLYLTTSTLAAALGAASLRFATPARSIRAIAFDALAIFDPHPIFARAEALYPEKGAELCNLWRTRQFEYSWLRAVSRHYANFWQVTEQALAFASKSLKLELTAQNRTLLMDGYLGLKPWPDAGPALATLKDSGMRLALLSNFTPMMLRAAVNHSKLEGTFDCLLSTDAVQTYKPDPRAYQLAVDAFQLKREQIAFVAFGGWDAAGARTFGFPTFWANRQELPAEELGATPDAEGVTLDGLPRSVGLGD